MKWTKGMVVKDIDGHEWIYMGHMIDKKRTTMRIFYRAYPLPRGAKSYSFQAAKLETIANKFPELAALKYEGSNG
jgi:hypothetical protein